MKECTVVQLSELQVDNNTGWRGYVQECQNALLKEVKEKTRGWTLIPSHYEKIEVSYKKVADTYPLRLWKITGEIEATPADVLHRILVERHVWDEELQATRKICQIDNFSDIFQYMRRNIVSLPLEDYCVLRSWKKDLPKNGCLLVETSVEHSEASLVPNSIRGIVLASRYLIEQCGTGCSRLTHLSRVDTR